ncbi:MAG: sulfonate transporter substrate-binding protein [Chloroflexi bacterium]|nr:sulfonate transporter substrate-binding protein [Chloroflexota bacterium]
MPAAYVGEGQGAGPLFVAQRAGLFLKEGLDVQIRLIEGSRSVVSALLGGEVSFANFAAPALLQACLDGADLVFLTSGVNQQFLGGRPGLTRVADLAGGRISVGDPGQTGDLLARYLVGVLKREGIDDIALVYGESNRARVDSIVSGRVDAAVITPPLAIEARRAGCRFLVDFADHGLNFTLGGIVTTRGTIDTQPDLVRRFIRGYVGGMHRYKTDRQFAMEVQQEYSGFRDQQIAEETYDITEPGFPRAPYPVTSGLQKILDTMALTDERAGWVDPRTMTDDRFIRELDERGHIAALFHELSRRGGGAS